MQKFSLLLNITHVIHHISCSGIFTMSFLILISLQLQKQKNILFTR